MPSTQDLWKHDDAKPTATDALYLALSRTANLQLELLRELLGDEARGCMCDKCLEELILRYRRKQTLGA